MFRLEETEIAKAIQRARELHLMVRIIKFGEYLVSESRGNRHTVRCYRARAARHAASRDGEAREHAVR